MVRVATPAADTTFEYGAIVGSSGTWIWNGPNGTFTVHPADEGTIIEAPGLVLP